MRILTQLSNPIRAFEPNDLQLARLAERLPNHDLEVLSEDSALVERLPDADAVVVWSFRQDWYAIAPKLRTVFTPSAGREQVQTDPRGCVEVVHGRFHGQIMAESLLGMILFMNRRLGAALGAQAARVWDRSLFETCPPLSGQIALIVGYGAIGKHVSNLLQSIGLRVHGLKRDATRGAEGALRIFSQEQLLEALAQADHVCCVLPGDTGTSGYFDDTAFAHMKPTAFLYNVGRGNAIDAGALARALKARRIGGAFLDVVPEEPLGPESVLWSLPNLFLTPHASAIRTDYLDLYFDELAQGIGCMQQS